MCSNFKFGCNHLTLTFLVFQLFAVFGQLDMSIAKCQCILNSAVVWRLVHIGFYLQPCQCTVR